LHPSVLYLRKHLFVPSSKVLFLGTEQD